MGIGDDVDQLAGLQAGGPGHHVDQDGVLDHVPVVGRQHILGPLVQNGVESAAGDVEGHGIGAGIQGHLVEVLEVVDIGEDAAGGGVVAQVVQHPVHLVKLPLGILVLHPQLIAVGLADGAGLVGPAVPDVAPEVVNVVGLLLPDPQQLVDAGFEIGAADGENGKLLPQVIAVDDAEFLHRVGRSTVLPLGADVLVCVPHPVFQDVPAVLLKYFIGAAHRRPLLIRFGVIVP